MVPHELLAGELATYDVAAKQAEFEKCAPPTYWTNPIKMNAEPHEATIPVSVFVDGCEYQDKDSLLGVSMTNLPTGKKYVVGAVRKKIMCGLQCGCCCSSWCSLFCIFDFLRWSLESKSSGQYPSKRHSCWLCETIDGWSQWDAERAKLGGQGL
eukprot:3420392-Amphidinium_carterae.1